MARSSCCTTARSTAADWTWSVAVRYWTTYSASGAARSSSPRSTRPARPSSSPRPELVLLLAARLRVGFARARTPVLFMVRGYDRHRVARREAGREGLVQLALDLLLMAASYRLGCVHAPPPCVVRARARHGTPRAGMRE